MSRAFVHGHTFLQSWSGPMKLVVCLLHGATFLSNLITALFVPAQGLGHQNKQALSPSQASVNRGPCPNHRQVTETQCLCKCKVTERLWNWGFYRYLRPVHTSEQSSPSSDQNSQAELAAASTRGNNVRRTVSTACGCFGMRSASWEAKFAQSRTAL